MESKDLDKLIRELRDMIDSNSNMKSVWELIKTIGQSFKGVRYPTPIDRGKSWDQFQSLVERVKQSQSQNRQSRERNALQSERYKNEIISRAVSAIPPSDLGRIISDTLFPIGIIGSILNRVLPGPEIDEMKQMLEGCSRQLKEGWKLFNSYKNDMLGKDKHESFNELKNTEVRINQAWEKWKESKQNIYQAKQAEKEAKQIDREKRNAEYQTKQNEWRSRMYEKIEKLEEVVRNKEKFIDNLESQISDLRDKRYEARSSSYKDRVDSWIEEKERKVSEVKEQIRDVESKIGDIKSKL